MATGFLLGVFSSLLVAFWSGAEVWPFEPQPSVTVVPNLGRVGTTFYLQGNHFEPGRDADVHIYRDATLVHALQATVGDDGELGAGNAVGFQLPDGSVTGNYRVRVTVDGEAAPDARLSFTAEPDVQIETTRSTTAEAGRLTIGVLGLREGADVRITVAEDLDSVKQQDRGTATDGTYTAEWSGAEFSTDTVAVTVEVDSSLVKEQEVDVESIRPAQGSSPFLIKDDTLTRIGPYLRPETGELCAVGLIETDHTQSLQFDFVEWEGAANEFKLEGPQSSVFEDEAIRDVTAGWWVSRCFSVFGSGEKFRIISFQATDGEEVWGDAFILYQSDLESVPKYRKAESDKFEFAEYRGLTLD